MRFPFIKMLYISYFWYFMVYLPISSHVNEEYPDWTVHMRMKLAKMKKNESKASSPHL